MAARGEQPTPFLCARLLFAALHSLIVIFASSNLQHKVWCVSTTSRHHPAGPPDKDGRTGDLTLCTTLFLCLAYLASGL